jgi:PAS domain S-box-containing protein
VSKADPTTDEKEKERLRELKNYFRVNSQKDSFLDSITLQSAKMFETKFAFISFMDEDTQWIQSSYGSDLVKLDKKTSLCGHAINNEDIFTIENAQLDDRFNKNPYVTNEPFIKFYAGVPLINSKGFRIGVLAIADIEEKKLSKLELEMLRLLSKQVVIYLDLKIKDLELDRAKKQFQKVQSISKAGLWELDLRTNKTTWSKEVFRIHAIEEEVSVQKVDAISYYAPHERQRITDLIEESIRSKSPFKGEFEFLDANGTHKWVRSAGYPQLDDKGNVTQLIGTFQDISDMKTASLREQIIFNQSFDSIMTISPPEWKFTSANPAALKTFKVNSESDFIKLGPWDLSPEFQSDGSLSSKRAQEAISIAMEKGTHFFEWTHMDTEKNKIECFVSLNRIVINDETFLQASVRDMTQKIEQEKEHNYILDTMRVGTFKWDMLKDDLQWSESNYNVFNIVEDDFNGAYDAWEKTLHPDFKEAVVQELSIALESSLDYNATFPIKLPCGEVKYIGAKAEITRDKNGKAVQMLGINWDKTKEYLAQEEIEKQKSLSYHNAKLISLGELAAGVGHEINNPLAIISGHCELISRAVTQEDLPKITDSISKVIDAVDRVSTIVKGLKTFSRSDTEEFSNFNLHNLLSSTIEMMKELYASEGVTITSNLSKDLYALGNRGRIQQVLVNLITNARDALVNASKKEISISVIKKELKLSIRVSDTGEGIDKEIIDKIFDPFFTSKEVNRGTGIGLSLCYRIINEHGGELTVESKKGYGSSFNFQLNQGFEEKKTIEAEQSLVETKKTTSEGFSGIHILVVEDEEPLRKLIGFFLEDMGFTFEGAQNGKEALEIYLSKPDAFDFILSDMQMPIMDGATLFKEVRQRTDLKQPKLLLLTGGVNLNFESKNNELGKMIDGFLSKPFKPEEIEEMLQSLV